MERVLILWRECSGYEENVDIMERMLRLWKEF